MRTEASMVSVLKHYLEDRDLFTVQEYNAGYGIADLVGFRISYENCNKRIANEQKSPLERLEFFKLLEALPDIESGLATTLSELSSVLPVSENRLQYHWLKLLEELGYVKRLDNKEYVKINGFIPIVKEIVAIEAKLTDWKKGAVQAKRYKVFADRTYLAIHERAAHRVDTQLLAKHGIGLLIVAERSVREEIAAPKIGPRDPLRYYLAGELAWKIYYRRCKKGTGASHAS
jgi:hypothetical protein